MELAIKLLLFLALGVALLLVNLWFIRSVYVSLVDPEFVIAPFNVVDPSGKAVGDKAGLALAQMMVVRLANLQAKLQAAHSPNVRQSNATRHQDSPLAITTLFVPRPVHIPTTLFEPVKITASVGGVEVGGLLSWVHRILAPERALVFTTYERADQAVISADLGNLVPGARIWFESDKHPDEVATNAAFALIQLRLAEKQVGPIKDLELADFRRLMETIFLVDELNRRAALGYVVEVNFTNLLPLMEAQVAKFPKWPELILLTANIADGAHNIGKAVLYYRKIGDLGDGDRVDPRIKDWAAKRLAALKADGRHLEAEAQERFVKASQEFARKMALPGADPIISFIKRDETSVQALWNPSGKRYEVNPKYLDAAGLPQHVALMGRFFDRNFDRCMGAKNAGQDLQWWNGFRFAVVDYLIRTEEKFTGVWARGTREPLFLALKKIEEFAGQDTTKRLAMELLNRYDCDWKSDTITKAMIKINDDRGFRHEKEILAAMSGQGFPIP